MKAFCSRPCCILLCVIKAEWFYHWLLTRSLKPNCWTISTSPNLSCFERHNVACIFLCLTALKKKKISLLFLNELKTTSDLLSVCFTFWGLQTLSGEINLMIPWDCSCKSSSLKPTVNLRIFESTKW